MNKNFKNKFFLNIRNKKLESEFENAFSSQRIKYNKWFSLIFLLSCIGDAILQNYHHNIDIQMKSQAIKIFMYTSFILSCLSFIIFILCLFIKNRNFQIFVTYFYYIGLFIPLTNIRTFLLRNFFVLIDLFGIFRTFEILLRVIMIMLVLVTFPHGLYMNIILLVLSIIYNVICDEVLSILFYACSFLSFIVISYYNTLNEKEKFIYQREIENQNKSYFNLIEHLHLGVLSFDKNENSAKIKLINNTLLEHLNNFKEIKNLIELQNENEERIKILKTNNKEEKLDINLEIFLKENSEKVLQIIFEDLQIDLMEKKEFLSNEIPNEFNLNFFLKDLEKKYNAQNNNQNFISVGFKQFRTVPIENNNEDSETENLIFEIYFRCKDKEEESVEFEVLIFDISKIRRMEEKNAELKYKTMFLSKVAHEIKNPVICISELVNNFYENYSKELKNTFNRKVLESFKALKQIVAFSDYLLILVRDFDLFSRLHLQQEVSFSIGKVDLEGILDYCRQVTEILIQKYNKHLNVQFILENNLPNYIALFTDEVKLKQVLTNFISNSIKSTNLGIIKLKLDLIQKNEMNFVKFEISDTGVGMTDEQLRNILKPFKKSSGADSKYSAGLGLYIVNQILMKMNSEFNIKSILGEGTQIRFDLLCEIEPLDWNDSKETDNLSERDNNLIIDRNEENFEEIGFKRKSAVDEIKTEQNLFRDEKEKFIMEEPEPDCLYYIVTDDEKLTLSSSIRVLLKAAENLSKKIKIFEAEDGIECLYLTYKLIKKGYKISAVLSDEMMNYLNGSTTAEIFKKLTNLNTKDIPFYLLSAISNIENKYIDHFFTKPLGLEDAKYIINPKIKFK